MFADQNSSKFSIPRSFQQYIHQLIMYHRNTPILNFQYIIIYTFSTLPNLYAFAHMRIFIIPMSVHVLLEKSEFEFEFV